MTAPSRLAHIRNTALAHQSVFWWFHSAYALALGVAFMWLGARDFNWLRIAAFNVTFVWVTSILAARVIDRRTGTSAWWRRLRLAINYVNRNAYQQVLFFILPVYYASATAWSPNMVFVAVLGVSAVLSTLDLVYDRFLTANRWRAAGFFAFNAFATVNVALPVLFGVANHTALRLATLAATLGFATIAVSPGHQRRTRTWVLVAAGAAAIFVTAETSRPLVPPAPLRLTTVSFGARFDRALFRITEPITNGQRPASGRVFAVTAVDAPFGLRDRVALRWSQGSRRLWSSAAHDIHGGRSEGFRLWSSIALAGLSADAPLRLEVVTDAGQLIGRAQVRLREPR